MEKRLKQLEINTETGDINVVTNIVEVLTLGDGTTREINHGKHRHVLQAGDDDPFISEYSERDAEVIARECAAHHTKERKIARFQSLISGIESELAEEVKIPINTAERGTEEYLNIEKEIAEAMRANEGRDAKLAAIAKYQEKIDSL